MQVDFLPPPLVRGGVYTAGTTVEEAAREFEAILLTQWMKLARETSRIDAREDSLTGSDDYMELAERQLAEAMASRDVLGFSKMILESAGVKSDKEESGKSLV